MAEKDDAHLAYERNVAHFQATISRQTLQLEKYRAYVGSAETWRQTTSESALVTAREGIKALILLNGGTFVALPAFKAMNDGVNIGNLHLPLMSFFLGLLFALSSFLLTYLAQERTALGWMEVEEQWRLSLSKADSDRKSEDIDADSERSWKRQRRHNYLCDVFSRISLVCAVASFLALAVGGFSGIAAFYPNAQLLTNVVIGGSMSSWLAAVGLTLDIIGAVLIFFFGVRPKISADGSNEVVISGSDKEVAKGKKYDWFSKVGIFLLILGFGLQLLASKLVFGWISGLMQ
ncbi:hypothetical protein TH19_19515 [Thalassospira profundimaris]|uniref:Uncharacterized protein n=1 Tax=Thalassospira profundimaris TaxID=502049 RepID=A0A367VZY3_9PROT|nr:hypothetical protein [Thalassospira profundimaris]RCK32284.1 hypothetical protein TH19_19515 [Thalassospira profundimaris]